MNRDSVERIVRYSILILTALIFCFPKPGEGSAPLKENYNIISLYKSGKYREIIELFYRNDQLNESEMILLGKSYEKLGFYHRSNRVFKELYNIRYSAYRLFSAYFVASNFEKLGDYSAALKWYRHILLTAQRKSEYIEEDTDSAVIVSLSFHRLVRIATQNSKLFHSILKIVEKFARIYPEANFHLGLLYNERGDVDNASASYLEVILGKEYTYKKKALIEIPMNSRTLGICAEKGLERTDLMKLFVAYRLYEKALITSYYLPYSAEVAKTRAVCFQGLEDFKTAAILFGDYYTLSKDPDALLKIAHLYYYEGAKKLSLSYLESYHKHAEELNIVDPEALFLKLQLERESINVESYIKRVEEFIRENIEYQGLDRITYDTFYFIRQKKDIQSALLFLSRTYHFLKKPLMRAWALYLLGIYNDKKLLRDAVTPFPGSYYYFQASRATSLDVRIIETADRLFNQGSLQKALDIYIHLYSKGVRKAYVRSKISAILRTQESYEPFYEIVEISSGIKSILLFELFKLGLYEELKAIVTPVLPTSNSRSKIILDFLLSKTYYKTGDIYKGILYAERMVNTIHDQFLLFLPEEILRLLYPFLYEDILTTNSLNMPQSMTPCFILSIIREESRFNSGAQSSKGALGLMQLMPSTANWISRKSLTTDELLTPTRNIQIGARYLVYLYEQFGSLSLVLAAYNGGPGNVKKWLSNHSNNSVKFIEEIPFHETRIFVKKVFTTQNIYEELYGKKCNQIH